MLRVILARGSRVQACVCQRECWYTTVLHLQWSLLRKELLVHVEQDSCLCAAECWACLWPLGTPRGYALCHRIVRGHKCGDCLCLLLPRPCPEQSHLLPTASDGRTVFVIENGDPISRGFTDPQCSIMVAGHLPCKLRPFSLRQVPVFVVW